jgi:hypothetical protein
MGKIHDQRYFFMFEREDKGFEYGQNPSGYVKIEVRGGKGKLSSMVQNLKSNDNICYRLYLIKCDDNLVYPVDIGIMQLKRASFEIEWSFDPEKVAKSDYSINEFNVAAILAEYSDRKRTSIECPLAAYQGKKTQWRKALEKFFLASAGQQAAINDIKPESGKDSLEVEYQEKKFIGTEAGELAESNYSDDLPAGEPDETQFEETDNGTLREEAFNDADRAAAQYLKQDEERDVDLNIGNENIETENVENQNIDKENNLNKDSENLLLHQSIC